MTKEIELTMLLMLNSRGAIIPWVLTRKLSESNHPCEFSLKIALASLQNHSTLTDLNMAPLRAENSFKHRLRTQAYIEGST